ncbi:MAG: alpha/beta hydrolase [Calditrichaceae bacterium]|nr:alpha/beta hydrolase [Calditrichaceae bacterium]MBN2708016.1 alpha/beta hydrolase [Calditrichaceae bacterium]RQV93957.1 MAG: alpha/beta hydrolase [Calditrichota bacterium]
MRLIGAGTAVILVIYLVYAFLLYSIQRSVIFPGKSRSAFKAIINLPANTNQVWLDCTFGKVEAWFVKSEGDTFPKPVIIHTHGNFELIEDCLEEAMNYNTFGVHVFLLEYPGYGRSEGYPSYETITESIISAYDWCANRQEIDSGKIVAMGRSLGGGAACALTENRPVKALILQSTFTRATDFARRFLLPSFLVKDRFDNRRAVENFNGPLLIFHGKRDEIIPYAHGKELHRIAQEGKFIDYNCGHNDFPIFSDLFINEVKDFLTENKLIH